MADSVMRGNFFACAEIADKHSTVCRKCLYLKAWAGKPAAHGSRSCEGGSSPAFAGRFVRSERMKADALLGGMADSIMRGHFFACAEITDKHSVVCRKCLYLKAWTENRRRMAAGHASVVIRLRSPGASCAAGG